MKKRTSPQEHDEVLLCYRLSYSLAVYLKVAAAKKIFPIYSA